MNEVNIMDFINLPVVAVCFIMGYVIKNYMKKIPNKHIPLIMLIGGSIIGAILSIFTSDMNLTNSIISGAVSGLASTGSYEFIVNTFGLKTNKETTTDESDSNIEETDDPSEE